MNIIRLIAALEEATSGALSHGEQETASEKLAAMPTHMASYGLEAVKCTDLGFKSSGTHHIYGMRPREARMLKKVQVSPTTLFAGQHDIAVKGIQAYITGEDVITGPSAERWSELPVVVIDAETSEMRVFSGHTRLGVQMLAGRPMVDVNAIKFDARTQSWSKI